MSNPAVPPTRHDAAAELAELARGTTTDKALAFFDSLPPISTAQMLGAWRGSGLPTQHPMDGLLDAFGWHGKRFDSTEDVHPLVFDKPGGGTFHVDPARMPISWSVHYSGLLKKPFLAALFRWFAPLLSTTRPKARLRMTEFRGVVTATMIYDDLPINDAFRLVDADTVLGVMDLRFLKTPFFFILRRE
jgi:hypothetical protein